MAQGIPPPGATPKGPSLAELLRLFGDETSAAIRVALPAKVVKYDRATQRADVVPVVREAVPNRDGSVVLEDLPIIPNVPVAWIRGGGYWMQLPLAVGDHVDLIFQDVDFSRWRESGALSDPGDLRRHDLSYPIAYPCIAPDAAALDEIGADEAVLDGPTLIRLGGPSADYVALAAKVDAELAAIKDYIDVHVHTGVTAGVASSAGPAAPMPAPASVAATKVKAE